MTALTTDPPPAGRFLIAFDAGVKNWDTGAGMWTRIDSHPNLVTSYQIDRGRQFELDRTDVGRATVSIADTTGILDPTNPAGPYYGKLEPLLQARLGRWNPYAGEWQTRYRGYIEDFTYDVDRSQRVSRLTITLVDIFEILAAIQMTPDFGDPGSIATDTPDSVGQVYFPPAEMQTRIVQALNPTNADIPAEFYVVFTGNVNVQGQVYSPGESPLTVIQEAADAEFPGVSNVYTDRFGRLCVHGRQAKFDPVGVASAATADSWRFQQWYAGDAGALIADDVLPYARIRELAYNRGLSKIINHALATPVGIADAAIAGQTVVDAASRLKYGFRSWSAQNLLTHQGLPPTGPPTPATALAETKRFAKFYVDNYKTPQNRINRISFRSIRPGEPGAGFTWELMSRVDIADEVAVTVATPSPASSGGFFLSRYFVEGVHEEVRPLNASMDDVTVSLDLSPKVFFEDGFPPA